MNRLSSADICAAKWEAVSVEGSVPPRAMVGVNGESIGIIDESDRFPAVVFEAQVAHLIAAAPDLYQALAKMMEGCNADNHNGECVNDGGHAGDAEPDSKCDFCEARAALAKARGES